MVSQKSVTRQQAGRFRRAKRAVRTPKLRLGAAVVMKFFSRGTKES